MKFGAFEPGDRPLVVAEVGNNHEGRMDAARALVEGAADCGADAVKFQTFRADRFVRPSDPTRLRRLQGFELTHEQFAELARLARARGLAFLSTPLDLPSVAVLEPLVDAYKIASGDITFVPLLDAVARSGKPVILSTGASTLAEVERAVGRLRSRGAVELALLHCVSCYPTPPDQANLPAIGLLRERFGVPVGYSDHVPGIATALAAAAAGARIIEKHFTLDHAFSDFRDHALSADPPELRRLVQELARAVKTGAGAAGRKDPQPCEREMIRAIRRSIVAAADLPRGRTLAWEDLGWMRPADGLEPGREEALLGRRLARDVRHGESLTEADVF